MERRQLEDLLVSQSFSHLSLLSPTPFPDQSPAFHGGPAVAWPVVIDCLTAHYVWLWVCVRVSATTPRKCHCPLTSIFAHFPAHFPAISPQVLQVQEGSFKTRLNRQIKQQADGVWEWDGAGEIGDRVGKAGEKCGKLGDGKQQCNWVNRKALSKMNFWTS